MVVEMGKGLSVLSMHSGLPLYVVDAQSSEPFAHTAHSIHLLRNACFARALTYSGPHGKEVCVYGMNALISYSFNPLYNDCMDAKLVAKQLAR